VVNIPLFRQLDPSHAAAQGQAEPPDLTTSYRHLLSASAASLVAVMEVIADRPEPVLLHCAAGKDRTGVATAIALSAVGVAPEAIVADYVRTQASLDGILERLAQGWSEHGLEAKLRRLTVDRPDLMLAPASAIEGVIKVLEAWPGATPGWLLDHGLAEQRLQRLAERLTVADLE
jgi:hypothetical protein